VAQQRESEQSMVAAAHSPFGALLKRYRVAAGLSQEALAERARLSTRGISDLERGRHRLPYRDTVARLVEALALDAVERAALEAAARGLRAAAPADNPLREGGARAAFLMTKLSVPPTRSTLVPRPRLLDRLHTGLHGPLTLLAAPAGSGKTTLLSAWHASAEGRMLPLAWVSLDAGDNDPVRFWSYVLTALDRLAPGVSAPALTLLQSPQPPSTGAVLATLLNGLDGVAADMVLILDDYHVIVAPPIHQGLAFLVQHLPPHLHLVLATQADPPLPLARLRAQGAVTEVRATDLRFTPEEAAAFLTEIMELPLSAAAIGALQARTEGWIVGLQLAALSLQGRPAEGIAPFIAAFTGSHRYVLDYLIDEVLLRQPRAVQTFLLHTCILERLCAPLCAAVVEDDRAQATNVAESQALLEGLERANLFVVPLDEERQWYRYHHLFAEALRQRLRGDTSLPDTALLHRRASAWFEGQELLREAISHALAAGAFEHAAVLMERIARTLYGQGALGTLHAWLDALPRSVVRARPGLCLVQSWLWLDRRRLDQAGQALQDAEEALHAVAPADGARITGGEIAATRALWAALGGDAVQAQAHAAAALDLPGPAPVPRRIDWRHVQSALHRADVRHRLQVHAGGRRQQLQQGAPVREVPARSGVLPDL
jgi:LuxR family maltose regulon positive regulatory protein